MKPFLYISLSILLMSCDKFNLGNSTISPVKVTQTKGMNSVEEYASNEKGRMAWQKPELLIESLGNLKGKKVADIGSGTGYFTFRLVREGASVVAIDVDKDMLNLVSIFKENMDTLYQNRIETRLVPSDDPMLTDQEVDIAIIINTIGYISDRVNYLQKVKKGLKDDGILMIVDFKPDANIPEYIAPNPEERLSYLSIRDDLSTSGFELIRVNEANLDYQYIIWALN
jgi:ubiquinone/menaquinone biosynthesis C-methylase UbiE